MKAIYGERRFSDKSYYFAPHLLWLCCYLSCSTLYPAAKMAGYSKWELSLGRSLKHFMYWLMRNASYLVSPGRKEAI